MLMLNKHNSSRGKQNVTTQLHKIGKSVLLYALLKSLGASAAGNSAGQNSSSSSKKRSAKGYINAAEHIRKSFGIAYNAVQIKNYEWEDCVYEGGQRHFSKGFRDFVSRDGMEDWKQCTVELGPLPPSELKIMDPQIMEDSNCADVNYETRWNTLWKDTYLMLDEDQAIYTRDRPALMLQNVLDFLSYCNDRRVKLKNKSFCAGLEYEQKSQEGEAELNQYNRLFIGIKNKGQKTESLNRDMEIIKAFAEGQLWPQTITSVHPDNKAFAKYRISREDAIKLTRNSTAERKRLERERREAPTRVLEEIEMRRQQRTPTASRRRKKSHQGRRRKSRSSARTLGEHQVPGPRTPRAPQTPKTPKRFTFPSHNARTPTASRRRKKSHQGRRRKSRSNRKHQVPGPQTPKTPKRFTFPPQNAHSDTDGDKNNTRSSSPMTIED